MAFQRIRIKNSNVAGKIPGADKLDTAELCLNLQDHKLYSKDADGNVFEIAGGGAQVPGGPTPPTNGNEIGDLFFDTVNNTLLYWDGTQWVPIAGDEALALDDLTDVVISNPASDELLVYNGSEWVNADPGYLTEAEINNILNGLNPDGTTPPGGADEFAKLSDIKDGKLTIKDFEDNILGEFTANQEAPTEITIPATKWEDIENNPITIGGPQPGNPSPGDIWIDLGDCPPTINIWDDCDDPGNPTWKPIGGGGGGGCVQGPVQITSSNGTELNSTLTAVGGNGVDDSTSLNATYEWTGAKTGSGSSIVADVEGNYTVTATITCVDGSTLSSSAVWTIADSYVDMVNNTPPVIAVVGGGVDEAYEGNSIYVVTNATVVNGELPSIIETQWFKDGVADGTGSIYTIGAGDETKVITAKQLFRDLRTNELLSDASNGITIVDRPADVITFNPVITDDGTDLGNTPGHVLTASAENIVGGVAPVEYAYNWIVDNLTMGSNKTLNIISTFVGKIVSCEITVAEPDGTNPETRTATYAKVIELAGTIDTPEVLAPADGAGSGAARYLISDSITEVEGGGVDRCETELIESVDDTTDAPNITLTFPDSTGFDCFADGDVVQQPDVKIIGEPDTDNNTIVVDGGEWLEPADYADQNRDEVWSSADKQTVTNAGSPVFIAGYEAEKAFDGDLTTYAATTDTGSGPWCTDVTGQFPAGPGITYTVRAYIHQERYAYVNNDINTKSTDAAVTGWVAIPGTFTELTSLCSDRNNNGPIVHAWEVNGKILVDTGVGGDHKLVKQTAYDTKLTVAGPKDLADMTGATFMSDGAGAPSPYTQTPYKLVTTDIESVNNVVYESASYFVFKIPADANWMSDSTIMKVKTQNVAGVTWKLDDPNSAPIATLPGGEADLDQFSNLKGHNLIISRVGGNPMSIFGFSAGNDTSIFTDVTKGGAIDFISLVLPPTTVLDGAGNLGDVFNGNWNNPGGAAFAYVEDISEVTLTFPGAVSTNPDLRYFKPGDVVQGGSSFDMGGGTATADKEPYGEYGTSTDINVVMNGRVEDIGDCVGFYSNQTGNPAYSGKDTPVNIQCFPNNPIPADAVLTVVYSYGNQQVTLDNNYKPLIKAVNNNIVTIEPVGLKASSTAPQSVTAVIRFNNTEPITSFIITFPEYGVNPILNGFVSEEVVPPATVISTGYPDSNTMVVDGGSWLGEDGSSSGNASAGWNQSKIWSDGISGDIDPARPGTYAFDGDTSTSCATLSSGTITFDLKEDFTGRVEFFNGTYNGVTTLKKDGLVVATLDTSAQTNCSIDLKCNQWVVIAENAPTFDTIEMISTSGKVVTFGFKVNGKILIDFGVSGAPDPTGDTHVEYQTNGGEGEIVSVNTDDNTILLKDLSTTDRDNRWIAENKAGTDFFVAGPDVVDEPLLTADVELLSSLFATTPDGADSLKNIVWELNGATQDAGLSNPYKPTLSTNTTYTVRVKHQGNSLPDSAWSTSTTFTTGATRNLYTYYKERVEQLEARIAGIEADEIVDDATDVTLLTAFANLVERVEALENP